MTSRRMGWVLAALGAGLALTAAGRSPAGGSPPPAAQPAVLSLHSSPSTVPAYTPASSRSEAEVIEAARLIGIPVVRAARFPAGSPVAFFCAAALSPSQ